MAVQQFCLRWNNHLPNFISVFTNLLTKELLVDVTLAAEGKQLQAHKVVLSACSTYFQSLFTSNPCQHPIVILKDIKFADLKTMVDFMYYGEVNVSQDQLPAILKTAETLKVKGLAEMPEQLSLSKSISSDKCESPSPISPSVLRRKRLRKSSTGSGSEQTSEDTAASGSTDLVVPSPVKHESEEGVVRHEASTESEHARESSHSFEEETVAPPRNLSEEGENSSTSNIRWSSSSEDNRAGTSCTPLPPQGWSFPEGFDVRSCDFPPFPYGPVRRKRSVNPQMEENFIAALEAVRSGGLGFCKAAKIYGVNNRTLWLEYKKRGYPLRPSTKSRAMVAEQQNMMQNMMRNFNPNNSLDISCSVPKIKLPPPPSPNFHNNVSQNSTTADYTTPLFNYSTL
uniref:Protein bric-a-brac 2 n=1 Tax=Lygus hesperus TaxID=30085 RepID=A0A0A9XPR6_LYGHE